MRLILPAPELEVRRAICRRCPTPCAHQFALSYQSDPCSVCPLPKRRWGTYTRCVAGEPAQTSAPAPESPGLATKLNRARREVAAWLKVGAPIAPKAVRLARLAQCEACAYYRAAGNWGLGECQAPGCGCTRAKLALAISTCPLTPPKWGPAVPSKR